MNGVYRSTTTTDAWTADDEVGGMAHLLFELDTTTAGLWRAGPDLTDQPVEVTIPARETILVLEGNVRVTIDRVETHELGPGDMLSIPAQSLVGWDPSRGCMVFWVYS